MDPELARALADRGRMPNLARLMAEGRTSIVRNPRGLVSSTVWATAITGCGPHRHATWSWRQLSPGTYRMQRQMRRGLLVPTVWSQLSEQGVSTLVFDMPTLELDPAHHGVGVAGWSDHDREDDLRTQPAGLARELIDRFDHVRLDPCEPPGDDPSTPLVRQLERSAAQKAEITRWLVEREPAAVAAVAFGEAHCGGHQLWPAAEEVADMADPATGPLADVYDAIDTAVGRVLELGDDATSVAAFFSHGGGLEKTPAHLMSDVLWAIDRAMGPPPLVGRVLDLARRTPNRVARRLLRWAGRNTEGLDHIADGSRRFFPLPVVPPSTTVRFNVVGREPHGRVHPEELDDVRAHLVEELGRLVDADSGHELLRRAIVVEDLYPGGAAFGMPDLILEWDCPEPVHGISSPTVGTIRGSYATGRVAGHRRDGALVVSGPGVTPGSSADIDGIDVAPTIAALVGVELHDVEGRAAVVRAR